jgi:actin-related protein
MIMNLIRLIKCIGVFIILNLCNWFYLNTSSFFLQVITIEKERYIVGEALFQPSILGLEDYGIVHQLVTSVSNVATEYHRQLLENTMLCGGTASMTG